MYPADVAPVSGHLPSGLSAPPRVAAEGGRGSGRQLVCACCGMSTFYSPRDLERHMRIHTGEKPFKCPFCAYEARLKAHLKSHMLRKHEGMFLDPSVLDKQPSS